MRPVRVFRFELVRGLAVRENEHGAVDRISERTRGQDAALGRKLLDEAEVARPIRVALFEPVPVRISTGESHAIEQTQSRANIASMACSVLISTQRATEYSRRKAHTERSSSAATREDVSRRQRLADCEVAQAALRAVFGYALPKT